MPASTSAIASLERKLTGEAAQFARIPDKIVEMGRLGQRRRARAITSTPPAASAVDPRSSADQKQAEAPADPAAAHPGRRDRRARLLRLANEEAKILGGHRAPPAIDTMYLNGYGFPAWRGGPMWQVDNVIGAKKAAERIIYQAKYGSRWKIAADRAPLAAGGTFIRGWRRGKWVPSPRKREGQGEGSHLHT